MSCLPERREAVGCRCGCCGSHNRQRWCVPAGSEYWSWPWLGVTVPGMVGERQAQISPKTRSLFWAWRTSLGWLQGRREGAGKVSWEITGVTRSLGDKEITEERSGCSVLPQSGSSRVWLTGTEVHRDTVFWLQMGKLKGEVRLNEQHFPALRRRWVLGLFLGDRCRRLLPNS